MIQAVASTFSWLLGRHISSALPEREERLFRTTANVQALALLAGALGWTLPQPDAAMPFFHFLHTFFFAEIAVSWLLLRNGFQVLGPAVCCIACAFHVILASFALPGISIYLFYPTAMVLPLLLINPRRPYLRFGLSLLPILAFALHQLHMNALGGQPYFGKNPDLLPPQNILLDVLFSQFVLLAACYTFMRGAFRAEEKLAREHQKSERLLLNILPLEVAKELKEKGHRSRGILMRPSASQTSRASRKSRKRFLRKNWSTSWISAFPTLTV